MAMSLFSKDLPSFRKPYQSSLPALSHQHQPTKQIFWPSSYCGVISCDCLLISFPFVICHLQTTFTTERLLVGRLFDWLLFAWLCLHSVHSCLWAWLRVNGQSAGCLRGKNTNWYFLHNMKGQSYLIWKLVDKLVDKLVKMLVQAGGQLLRQRSPKTMTGLTSCTSSAGRSSNCLTDSFSICWGGINWSVAAGSALISTGQSISNAVSALSWPFRITIMLFWLGFGCGVGVPW